jgi:hypothetical protein
MRESKNGKELESNGRLIILIIIIFKMVIYLFLTEKWLLLRKGLFETN